MIPISVRTDVRKMRYLFPPPFFFFVSRYFFHALFFPFSPFLIEYFALLRLLFSSPVAPAPFLVSQVWRRDNGYGRRFLSDFCAVPKDIEFYLVLFFPLPTVCSRYRTALADSLKPAYRPHLGDSRPAARDHPQATYGFPSFLFISSRRPK